MPIIRCSDQTRNTLEDFYRELVHSNNEYSELVGHEMLKILKWLNNHFPKTQLYGLTSHMCLKILSKNDYRSKWHVSIIGANPNLYYIEYLEPNSVGFNPIKFEAHSFEEAQQLILHCIEKSKGWENL